MKKFLFSLMLLPILTGCGNVQMENQVQIEDKQGNYQEKCDKFMECFQHQYDVYSEDIDGDMGKFFSKKTDICLKGNSLIMTNQEIIRCKKSLLIP